MEISPLGVRGANDVSCFLFGNKSFLLSYDVTTTLGHERLSTVLEKMTLYSWVVRPWHPHRYEGPHHSTQDLKCICQIRDNDLIYITNCHERHKNVALLC